MPVPTSQFAVIGGSNAFRFLHGKQASLEPLGQIETPFGRSSHIFIWRGSDAEFHFLSRHGVRGYDIAAPFVNYRANIYALKDFGVESIIAWSGPGAIREGFRVGELVIPDDVIDETRQRSGTFYKGSRGLGFIRQNPVFCPELAAMLASVLAELGYEHTRGATYVCTEGPRLETPAEIRKYGVLGGDLVGMTLAPECFLARELEMCYVPLCYVTNYAEGVRRSEYVEGELFEGLLNSKEKRAVESAVARFPVIIEKMAAAVSGRSRTCPCSRSMERYRRSGTIGGDWHNWLDNESSAG